MEQKKNLTVQYLEMMRFEAFQENEDTYHCLVMSNSFPKIQKKQLSRDQMVSELNQFCPQVPNAILNFFVRIAMQYETILKITRNNSMSVELNDIVFLQYSAVSLGCTIGCKPHYEQIVRDTANQNKEAISSERVFGIILFSNVTAITAEKIITKILSASGLN